MRLNKILIIRVSEDEKLKLKELADKEGFSMSLLIKRLIRAYIKSKSSS